MTGPMIAGDMTFEKETAFSGMIAGDAIVVGGSKLTLTGMVRGDLIIEQGGHAIVSGMVGGSIVNHGGTLEMRPFSVLRD